MNVVTTKSGLQLSQKEPEKDSHTAVDDEEDNKKETTVKEKDAEEEIQRENKTLPLSFPHIQRKHQEKEATRSLGIS